MKIPSSHFTKKIKKIVYTFLATRRIGGYEDTPNVNRYCHFTKNTFLGKNCHFNGMTVEGGAG